MGGADGGSRPGESPATTAGKQSLSAHQSEALTYTWELRPQVLDAFTTGKDRRLAFTILSGHLFKT